MVDARYMVRRHFGRGHHPVLRGLARTWIAVVWPFAAAIHLWQIRRFSGPKEAPSKRLPGAIWAALRHNILPGEYYAYALWKPDRRAQIDHYLYSNEAPRLFKLLNQPSQSDPIGDKLAFFEMCRAHTLPTPGVLAAFNRKGILIGFETGWPPKSGLFAKPRFGFAGQGTERFHWHDDAFRSDRGAWIKPRDLNCYFVTRARDEQRALIVQPLLLNHPCLRIGEDEALVTARLVTGLSSDDNVVPIFGFVYFGRAQKEAIQHSHVMLIDVTNGRLVLDSLGAPRRQLRDVRDAAGSLPDWQAALHYAQIAHRACRHAVFIGWDIAFTANGPMLLEGNANWNADEYQVLSGKPLGHTNFAKVLEKRLRSDALDLTKYQCSR